MKMLTLQDFRQLAQVADATCVSLLMPTHRSGRETTQDPIRLKNLLGEAAQLLTARGQRTPDARQRLGPLRELIDDTSFWAHRSEGLAAFSLPDETHVFAIPFSLPQRVVIGHHAYLVPLIPVVSEDLRFFVLALSPKQVRLFEGTRYTARELELPGWPENFEQLAAYIEEEPQLQFRTEAAPGSADRGRAAVFHGHPGGEESSKRKERLREYCRLIDRRVQQAVGDADAPLVLACDERLAAAYRSASDYARVVAQPVAGNPDSRKAAELCGEAWRILEPEVVKARDAAVARYHQAAAQGQAAGRLDAVLPAAHDGRVDTLLVAADAERWGRYDPDRRRLDVHEQPAPDDDELVNLATVVSYRQGAAVHRLPQEEMPHKETAVALLRY